MKRISMTLPGSIVCLSYIRSLTSNKNIRLLFVVPFFTLALSVFSGNAYGQQTVQLVTLSWPPYTGKDLMSEGYAAELIRTAFERSGYQVQYYFMPWSRAVKTITSGYYDGLAPVYFTEKRKKEFSMTDSFPAGQLVLAKRKGEKIIYNRIEDLKPYKIAVVSGYANTKEFDEAKYLQKSICNSDITGYRRLLFGTVDLWLVDKFVGQYIMAHHLPERAKEIEFIKKPIGIKNLHVIFTKKKSNHLKLANDFNKGLAEVMNDGTLSKVLASHGLSLR
jgi:polar amino acid transport system substrate-binding protein